MEAIAAIARHRNAVVPRSTRHTARAIKRVAKEWDTGPCEMDADLVRTPGNQVDLPQGVVERAP